MAPTAALFDAINRGDIIAARDALNRGADLNAQNVLGMTPIDLSVDLGRNDITFLLLSMRSGSDQAGAETGRRARPGARRPSRARPAAAGGRGLGPGRGPGAGAAADGAALRA